MHKNYASESLGAQGRAVSAGNAMHYELKLTDLKYLYDMAEPVVHVRSRDTFETTTADADADGLTLTDANLKVMGQPAHRDLQCRCHGVRRPEKP
jgi:hypothetical protein